MCHIAVHRRFLVFGFIPDKYKTQEVCNLTVSLYPSFIVSCPYKYITLEMCDEAAVDYLAALKLTPDWFVTSKMIKKLLNALYANENILYLNEDSGDAVFNRNETVNLDIDLNNISLDNNFDEDDPDTIILIRILAWHIKLEKRKELK